MLNLLGAAAYAVTALLAGAAALRAEGRDRRAWLAVVLVFLILAAWRLLHGEALVQDWARGFLRAEGGYEARRAWQAPVTALGLLGTGLILAMALLRQSTALLPRRAQAASLALLALSLLRTVSFHGLDALLHAKPGGLRINHLIDMGLTGLAGACALLAAMRGVPLASGRSRG